MSNTTISDWIETALDILKQSGSITSTAQLGDIAKANGIALGLEELFGVRPTVLQDTTVSPPTYTLYFEDTAKATNAIVETLDRWRGNLNSGDPSNVNYDFSGVLIPAIVREFFVPIAAGLLAAGGIGYFMGKGK